MSREETAERADERRQIRLLRLVSLLEGTTLIALLFGAVPLKHLGGYPIATSIIGPIHGMAFLVYVWFLMRAIPGGDWSRGEIFRLLIAAFIPLGAFAIERSLRRKEAALPASA